VAWDRLLREVGLKQRNELLTDIGLGKRLAAVVAKQLVDLHGAHGQAGGEGDEAARPRASSPILIHGGEGMAVQMARCCRPIPGDPIVGMIRKGQGLEVHVNDCPVLTRNHSSDRDRWVDVEWELGTERMFDVNIRVIAEQRRGVLARVASAITDQEAGIQNVSMESERAAHITINFTLQVQNRLHLARIMRAIRRIPDVVRINRTRGDKPAEKTERRL
jgi:GTP diphosphokinase / guanosine-3',5'-bis(diphosphate) 3'-diphosphatase